MDSPLPARLTWRGTIALATAALGAWAAPGCDQPGLSLLRSPEDAGRDACAGDACAPPPPECSDDRGCIAGTVCLAGACEPCGTLGDPCAACPQDTVPASVTRNGCALCACVPSQCDVDEDCPIGSSCTAGACTPCDAALALCPAGCPAGFSEEILLRGGCPTCECTPPTECRADTDCELDDVCYAGAACDDGCASPSCCRGNVCGLPGCPPIATVGCHVGGCGGGATCDTGCEPTVCYCDPDFGEWLCDAECDRATCVP